MADFETIADRIGLPEHMRINRLDPENKTAPPLKTYTVLVNPSTYSVSYAACYSNDQSIGDKDNYYHFNKAKEQTMSIDLLFDETGSLGKMPLIGNKPVLEQIEEFLDVAYVTKGNERQFADEHVMQLVWGKMNFLGVLSTVKINYSHFDASGNPIRAKASCVFKGGEIQFKKPKSNGVPPLKKKKGKKIDFAKQKHAINAVQKYSHYVAVVAQQPETAMPKSLRIAAEVAKLIIK